MYFWRQCFAEVKYTSAKYSDKEAKQLLSERFEYYLDKQKQSGYKIISARLYVEKTNEGYAAFSNVKMQKEQNKYRKINEVKEGNKQNGDNGNSSGDTN